MLSEKELKEMMELEDYAHFRAELVEISPQSFDINELKEILGDMIRSKVAMEDNMRDSFAELSEVEQTQLLDMLGERAGTRTATGGTGCSRTAPGTGRS